MSFRSQGDQREHSNMADRYLFSSDQIQLWFNRLFLYPNTKIKQKENKEKAVLLFVQISISKLSVNYISKTIRSKSHISISIKDTTMAI